MNRTPPGNDNDNDNDNEASLDQALDALAQGDRAALDRLDPGTRAAVDHLYVWAAMGGLEDVTDQAPAYAAPPIRFARPDARTGRQSRGPVPMDASIPRPAPVVLTLPKADRRVAPALWSAFAWLMIAALAGASIYGAIPFFRESGPANPTMTAFQAGTATPEAAGETGVVNYGGDAGRTWHFGNVEPSIGKASILGNLSESPIEIMGQPLVVGDTIIATILGSEAPDGSAIQTIRHDLVTGEQLWTSSAPLYGPFATDGEFVYGLVTGFFSRDIPEDTPSPGAIRLDTGDLEMGLAPLAVVQASAPGPIISDGIAHFADAYGNVSAIDPSQISPPYFQPVEIGYLGQHPERPGFGVNIPDTDLVISGDWLFVVRPSKTVVKYDRHTGEELGSFNLVDTLRGEVGDVTLQVVRNRLVVTAGYADIPAGATARPASILLYDADSLIPVARGDLPDLRSNLVVTPDWIYLAGRLEGDDAVRTYRMNPVGATFGEPFSQFSAPADASLGLSLSENTLMVVGPPNSFSQVDVERETVVSANNVVLPDGDSLTVFPMQLWGQTPVTVSSGGDIVVIGETPEGS